MSDRNTQYDLYEFAEDTLTFAKRRFEKHDYKGEEVALEYLHNLVKKLRSRGNQRRRSDER